MPTFTYNKTNSFMGLLYIYEMPTFTYNKTPSFMVLLYIYYKIEIHSNIYIDIIYNGFISFVFSLVRINTRSYDFTTTLSDN